MLGAHAQEMDGCDARRRRCKDLQGCAISSASGCLNWHRHMTSCPQKIASGSIRRSQARFSKRTGNGRVKTHLCAFLGHGEIALRLKTSSALLPLAGRNGSLPILPRVLRRVQLFTCLWKRQKPTTCGWMTICFSCSAYSLSAQGSARTLGDKVR